MRQLTTLFLIAAGAAWAFPNPDGGCNITTGSVLPRALYGKQTSFTIAVTGCTLPIKSASIATGYLPSGLSLSWNDNSVTISGVPYDFGTATFSLRVIDSAYNLPSKSFAIRVVEPLKIVTQAAATGQPGAAYNDRIQVRGGSGSASYSIVGGSLPSGLALSATTGVITGTMPATGSQFRVRVTDTNSSPAHFDEQTFTIRPNGQISTSVLPNGQEGSAYSVPLTGSLGGSGFYLGGGSLPEGLTLSTGGLISGTPTASGEFQFVVAQTVDSISAWRSYRLLISSDGGLYGSVRDAEETFAYESSVGMDGGLEPFTYTVTGGALPPGITLDAGTGALLGELQLGASGSTFTITATDRTGRTFLSPFTINAVTRLTGSAPLGLTPPAVRTFNFGTITPYGLAGGSANKSMSVIGGMGRDQISFSTTVGEVFYYFYESGTYIPVVVGTDDLGGAVRLPAVQFTAYAQPLIARTPELPNGLVGVAYNGQVVMARTTFPPISFELNDSTLPDGLALNPTTGAITGTPAVGTGGSQTLVRVLATDSAGGTDLRRYWIGIGNVMQITTTAIPPARVGVPYSFALSSINAANPSWSIPTSSGPLPAGLTLSAAGVISGTPTQAGEVDFAVRADQAAAFAVNDQKEFTMLVGETLTATPLYSSPLEATLGEYLYAPISTNGGQYPMTVSVTGVLPEGAYAADESEGFGIFGTAESLGTYSVTVNVTSADGQTVSFPYVINVRRDVTMLPQRMPPASNGVPYSHALVASGGRAPYTFSLVDSVMPPGLNLAPDGTITGTPTTNGDYNVYIEVIDVDGRGSYFAVGDNTFSRGNAARKARPGDPRMAQDSNGTARKAAETFYFSVRDPLAITNPIPLPTGTALLPYSTAMTVTGGNGSNQFRISSGETPPLVLLNEYSGALGNIPLASGVFPFSVQVEDSDGRSATQATQISIGAGFMALPASLPNAIVQDSYQVTLPVSLPAETSAIWSLVSGSLPPGLTLGSNGVISGTATQIGAFPFVARATSSQQQSSVQSYSITVVPRTPELTVTPPTLSNPRVGQPYSATISASGGFPPYTLALVQGNLPPGLTFVGGLLSGTPAVAGEYRFAINATDSSGFVAGNLYTMIVDSAFGPLTVTPATITSTARLGQAFSVLFGATGGQAPYTFAFTGTLPPGLTATPDGLLNGTPTGGGSYPFTVTVTDARRATASANYTVTVTGGITITTRDPLPGAVIGAAYSLTFEATGGQVPYTWALQGALPAGLSFDTQTGGISGTPTAAGTFPLTVEVRDTQRGFATARFTLTSYGALEITNAPGGEPLTTSLPYTFTFTTRGGAPPVTLAVSGGNLPPGLALSPEGVISGRPSDPGTFPFTVQATDASGNRATRQATLVVGAGLMITTQSLPIGAVGSPYLVSLAVTGGTAPLSAWSITAGTLPAGLTMGGDGVIRGTPTTIGTSNITVRISDSAGGIASRNYALVIRPAVPPTAILGLPETLPPGAQRDVGVEIPEVYADDLDGTLILEFTPNAVNNSDDPAVQFSTGGRTVTFRIPAGQRRGVFPADPLRLLSGTVAGTMRVRSATAPAPANGGTETVVPIPRAVPVITAGTAQLGTNSFTLVVDGYSNTREISSATFRLTPVAGATLQTTEIPVAVGSAYTSWYQSAASFPFGGQFRLTVPFNVSGSVADIDSIAVTVTNTVGASSAFTIRLR